MIPLFLLLIFGAAPKVPVNTPPTLMSQKPGSPRVYLKNSEENAGESQQERAEGEIAQSEEEIEN